MTGKVFKSTKVVGTSDQSVEEAIRTAIRTTAKSVRNLAWFHVVEIRGSIENGDVGEFQVTMDIGFRYEA